MSPAPRPQPASFGGGRYEVDGVLGHGSMGIVYRVRDTRRDVLVALKTLEHTTPTALRSLKREFRTLADLRHPHLVELYELAADDPPAYFTMSLLDGPSLAARTRRPNGSLDVDGFRQVASELSAGIDALHAAGRLHRDVKPTNVACAADGRVVLLDFGLAAIVGRRDAAAASVIGTPTYAAPEQLWGAPVGPPADWYAFGAVIAELATGVPPWSGSPALIAQQKRAAPIALRDALSDLVPADLVALIASLLEPDPDERPTAAAVRAALGRPSTAKPSVRPSRRFVGRATEIERLRRALAQAAAGTPTIVRLTGPSGIGKSALIEHFLVEHACGATVLRARCHPHEHVRFNAIDGLVDDLSHVLDTLPPDPLAAPYPAALRQLFPVLEHTRALDVGGSTDAPRDPVAVRRAAFTTLRRILARLATDRPVVAWIDDVQWADDDSDALLAYVLQPPAPPPLLLLTSGRPAAHEPAWLDLATECDVQALSLGPLADDDLTALVTQALEAQDAEADIVHAIRGAAGGSPFVAAQLASDIDAVRAAAASGPIDAASLLAGRVEGFSAEDRRILEIAALGARPLPPAHVLEAAGLPPAAELRLLGLERDRMLRTATRGTGHTVEPYHDRIREAVLATLDAPGRRARHAALGRTLENAGDFDPDEVFVHYRDAGDVAGARRHGEAAGDQAAQATAFERAARRYDETLALTDESPLRLRLLEKLAEAQANAGRCGAAGATFERAADLARAERADALPTLRLRYRRAIEYLHGGQLDRGLAAVGDVLGDVAITVPATRAARGAAMVVQRCRLAVRRVRVRPGPPTEATRLRLEALGRLGLTVSMYDPLLADVIVTRHCLDALDAGDVTQAAVALATDGAKSAQIGGRIFRARSRRLFAHVDRLEAAVPDGDPYWPAYLGGARVVAAYEEGRWQACHVGARETRRRFAEQCRGVSWELATFDAYALTTLAQMGRFDEVRAELPSVLQDAEARGDHYAAIALRSSALSLVWLANDQPAELRRDLDRAMARFPAADRFGVQHYLHLIAVVQAALHLGDGRRAWELLAEAWKPARRSGFLLLETPATELRGLRARAALLRLATERLDPRRGLGRALLATARRDEARVGAARITWATAAAAMLRAGRMHVTGEADAAPTYRMAAGAYDAADMRAHAAACRACADGTGPVAPLTRALTGRA